MWFDFHRKGLHRLSTAMQGFSDFIAALGLIDPQLEGGTFTWSNSRDVEARSRIDRFLFSPDWEDHFPSIIQTAYASPCCRITSQSSWSVVNSRNADGLSAFEKMWFKADGFVDRVRQWWLSYQFDGSPSYILANKLKALKADLKKWNTESFGNVGIKKNQLLYELHEIDRAAESRILTFDEKLRKESLVTELEKTILLDEISWRQKSRVLWLKEGDRNTQFFHRMANSNRRNNSISTLLIDGEMSTDQMLFLRPLPSFILGYIRMRWAGGRNWIDSAFQLSLMMMLAGWSDLLMKKRL
jgi:hypothetical protein